MIKKNPHLSKDEAAEFYKVHQSKPFYDVMFLSIIRSNYSYGFGGQNAILLNRKIMGATDPKNAEDGTIRKLWTIN